MDRRTLITCVVLPLGFAGVFLLTGLQPWAVVFLFASLWTGRGLRLVARRWRTGRLAALLGDVVLVYDLCSVAVLCALVGGREALSAPTLSFLVGVCAFKLWVLFSLPLWSDRPWAFRLMGGSASYLLVVLGALTASVAVHGALFAGSPVLGLPLLAGFFVEFVLLITASELLVD